MKDYTVFEETNSVYSAVFYEWRRQLDIRSAFEILQKVAALLPEEPDVVTLADEKGGKSYKYKSFVSRKVLDRKDGDYLSLQWNRSKNILSDFSINVVCGTGRFKNFRVHVDDATVASPRDFFPDFFRDLIYLLVQELDLIYGIGYTMPYYYGPSEFAIGTVARRYATEDGSFYGAPEIINERSCAFNRTFLKYSSERHLDTLMRDVFEVNYLSRGHLDFDVGGALEEVIRSEKIGKLAKICDSLWVWTLGEEEIGEIRPRLIEAGMLVVTI